MSRYAKRILVACALAWALLLPRHPMEIGAPAAPAKALEMAHRRMAEPRVPERKRWHVGVARTRRLAQVTGSKPITQPLWVRRGDVRT